MLKFLLIFGLVMYALYKFGNLFYQAGINSQRGRRDNTINIDQQQKKRKGKVKGGEYVDYEEIK